MTPRPGYVVALTGGIAAGKSAVSRRFEALGVHAYDADVAAREVVAPGSEGLAAIVSHFGASVLDADGQLDRAAMRERIFGNDTERHALETITHPRVRAWLRERVLADRGPYCLLAIPLFAENHEHYRWVDRVLVVDAPESLQLQRLMQRDGIDEELARRMIERQARREHRLSLAHDVIGNSGDEAALDQAVAELHARYLSLAQAKH
ncbi:MULTISPECIES: dephospho-CoA kinase [unclassified Dyella]|uniref:dephospho-CoA kinase n=1 Tax=unclassified Dyella TaxID=2634549 RepID=UPI000C860AF1|nr:MULTISPECIES: dephospho-CoA kinase [unclassified Dyella]MDR3444780.1 dephospho-CoA kinase [Dyella sp.]PMQ06849.1 Dephospho-CoA kinase [Dyella sp. AD56]